MSTNAECSSKQQQPKWCYSPGTITGTTKFEQHPIVEQYKTILLPAKQQQRNAREKVKMKVLKGDKGCYVITP